MLYLRFCCAGWRSWSYESDQTGRLLQDRTGSLLILQGDLKAPKEENTTVTTSYLFILSQNSSAGSDIEQSFLTEPCTVCSCKVKESAGFHSNQSAKVTAFVKLIFVCNETSNNLGHSWLVAENLHFFSRGKGVLDRSLNHATTLRRSELGLSSCFPSWNKNRFHLSF